MGIGIRWAKEILTDLKMFTFGVQKVSPAMPTLLITRASSPTTVPTARKRVLLNEHDVVIPAGNDVGH
jgi:hypothetical protein